MVVVEVVYNDNKKYRLCEPIKNKVINSALWY